MSGQAPYGYQLEPTVVEGIRTKKMVADPVAADHVRLMFEMYAEPETSFGDITRYYLDNWDSIDFDDKRKAADGLISTIKATSDHVQIEWKI